MMNGCALCNIFVKCLIHDHCVRGKVSEEDREMAVGE